MDNPYESPGTAVVTSSQRDWFKISAIAYLIIHTFTHIVSWQFKMKMGHSSVINIPSEIAAFIILPSMMTIIAFVLLTIIRYPMIPGWYKRSLKWSMFICSIIAVVDMLIVIYSYVSVM